MYLLFWRPESLYRGLLLGERGLLLGELEAMLSPSQNRFEASESHKHAFCCHVQANVAACPEFAFFHTSHVGVRPRVRRKMH